MEEQGQYPVLLQDNGPFYMESEQKPLHLGTKHSSQDTVKGTSRHFEIQPKAPACKSGNGALGRACTSLQLTSAAQQHMITKVYFNVDSDVSQA